MSEFIIDVSDLSIMLKGSKTPLVSGVSFRIEKGKTLAIVGESGSGKTMTSLSLMGLLPVGIEISSGSVVFHRRKGANDDLRSLGPKEMRRIRGNEISMIFQEPMTALNPSLSCGSQLAEMFKIHTHYSKRKCRQLSIDLLSKVQLPDPEKVYQSYPHQLSGGQRQRVMIAMAVACKPLLLIADEPTTALDVTVQHSVMELLKSLQSEMGMALLFISHDLALVSSVADCIMVMHQGKVVEQGSTEQILKFPCDPYTKGLIACRPPSTGHPSHLLTVDEVMKLGRIPELVDVGSKRALRLAALYDNPPLLNVQGLKVYYPRGTSFLGRTYSWFKAVDDVSFQVWEGETLGLVGESGSGKSTIARAVLNLIEPTAGKVIFNETWIAKLRPRALRKMRREMQLVFQDPYSSLNPSMRIGAALQEPLKVHKKDLSKSERRQKVAEMLKKVGLDETDMHKYPHQLSGGQRQRVVIARALMLNPKLVFLDESVSALDVSVQAQVLNLLNELKQDLKLTFVFITHDLNVVRYMADRIMVLQHGCIVECNDADRIMQNPSHAYTQKLIEAMP